MKGQTHLHPGSHTNSSVYSGVEVGIGVGTGTATATGVDTSTAGID